MRDAQRGVLLAAERLRNKRHVFGLVAVALVVGCGSATQTPDGSTGTMDAGREVALPPALVGRPGVGLYAWRGGSALWTLREAAEG